MRMKIGLVLSDRHLDLDLFQHQGRVEDLKEDTEDDDEACHGSQLSSFWEDVLLWQDLSSLSSLGTCCPP